MPLGEVYKYNLKKAYLKGITQIMGILDLHSHIRWMTIKRYINKTKRNAEIGSGWGLMAFEFIKATGESIVCIDKDPNLIKLGETFSKRNGIDKVIFIIDSLPKLSKLKGKTYDQILLIDVLEHVTEDLESLIRINSLLKVGGNIIISVPTPNYSKYFGRRFANVIGHVRDGYSIKELGVLLESAGFKIIKWSYHTNFLSSYLCKLWYYYDLPSKLKILLFPFLRLLIFLDFVGKGINSCGIAVKAIKVRDVRE